MIEVKETTWLAPLAAVGLGLAGGLVRLMMGWHGGKLTAADYRNAAIDLFGSAFITLVVYMATKWGLTVWLGPDEIHEMMAVAGGGMAGHFGVRATILKIDQYLKRKLTP